MEFAGASDLVQYLNYDLLVGVFQLLYTLLNHI